MKTWNGLTLILAGLLVFPVLAGAQEARKVILSDLKGPVQVRVQEGAWKPAEAGMVLFEKDEIRTAEGGFAELLIDEEGNTGKLELSEKSYLKLDTLDWNSVTLEKVTLLDLTLGHVLVQANKLYGDSQFEVKTPRASAGVRGTVFEVSVEEE